jgi:hypothetical protein
MSEPPVELEGGTLTLTSTTTLVFKGIWLITNPHLREDLQAIKSKLEHLKFVNRRVGSRHWFIQLVLEAGLIE